MGAAVHLFIRGDVVVDGDGVGSMRSMIPVFAVGREALATSMHVRGRGGLVVLGVGHGGGRGELDRGATAAGDRGRAVEGMGVWGSEAGVGRGRGRCWDRLRWDRLSVGDMHSRSC